MATHLIQFPDKGEHKKAIRVLLEVPVQRLGLPDLKMVVSGEHIEALKRAGIQFVDLTKVSGNAAASVQP